MMGATEPSSAEKLLPHLMLDAQEDAPLRRDMPFRESDFRRLGVLGEGAFSVVFAAEFVPDETGRTQVALKTLSKSDVVARDFLANLHREKRLLARMDCPFIQRIFGSFQTPDQVVLVTEVLPRGDLWTLIYRGSFRAGLPTKLVQFYTASITVALAYMHERGVVYRDLKPSNVMVDARGYLRVIDFGFARVLPETRLDLQTGELRTTDKLYTICGTPEYWAPEFVYHALGHDKSADVWALGVMVFEMLTATLPFGSRATCGLDKLLSNIVSTVMTGLKVSLRLEVKTGSKAATSLVQALLKPAAADRLDAQLVLAHPFFAGLSLDALSARTLVPPHVPRNRRPQNPPQNPPVAFTGNQAIFAAF